VIEGDAAGRRVPFVVLVGLCPPAYCLRGDAADSTATRRDLNAPGRHRLPSMTLRRSLAVAALAMLAAVPQAGAQTATFYTTRAAFLAALGAAPLLTQDFESIALGTSVEGSAVVPGLTVHSPFPRFEVVNVPGSRGIFGFLGDARETATGYYEFVNGGGFNALGFDVAAWDPATAGANVVISFAVGGPMVQALTATNALETDPVFFGVITSVPFTTLRLNEPLENIIPVGNEEVALDDIAAAAIASVPEPSTVLLVATGLLVAGVATRRRAR
jgi:hypothetical protein